MDDVKRYRKLIGEHPNSSWCYVVRESDFDAQRLRADTAEAELKREKEFHVVNVSEAERMLAAAEQRMAEMSKLLKRCIPVCRFKNSHTERDLIADIDAALNPKP